jgi:hypothetical protein
MDIFMSGMSGQEAARMIRTLPEPARSTPIVALTANVGPKDETLLRASGMNGVLGKPVSLPELLSALDRFVWSGGLVHAESAAQAADCVDPGASVHKPSDRRAPGAVPVLAAARINELRTNLPAETFTNLVEECLTDIKHRLPALRRALTTGAPGPISAHAHALVGIAAGYGMSAVEARLRGILAAVRDGDMMLLGPTVITDLEADLAEAADSLRQVLSGAVVLAEPAQSACDPGAYSGRSFGARVPDA